MQAKEDYLAAMQGTGSAVPQAVAVVAGEKMCAIQQPPLLQFCNCKGGAGECRHRQEGLQGLCHMCAQPHTARTSHCRRVLHPFAFPPSALPHAKRLRC